MSIEKSILDWYGEHARSLPWRRTHDPYRILVSEVMLQQTQVERVVPKYQAFLKAFPSVRKLAEAKTSDVIRAWAGLGYNRRALYLQRTALAVVRDFGGVFPRDIVTLKTLPGIGDYTARAILSFAFREPLPMMDTNHRRFYQRVFFGLRKKDDAVLLQKAEKIFHEGDHSTSVDFAQGDTSYRWNQALMDFGSLVCVSQKPKCEICPIQKFCKAYPGITRASKHKNMKAKVPHTNGKDAGLVFRQTDRYIRGKIVAILRKQGRINATQLQKEFHEFAPERLRRVVDQLKKDGLIVAKKDVILLPE